MKNVCFPILFWIALFPVVPTANAQESGSEATAAPATPIVVVDQPGANKSTLEEIFTVPEGKSPEELLRFLSEARNKGIKATLTPDSTQEEMMAFQTKFVALMGRVADKIIASQAKEPVMEQAYQLKMISLSAAMDEDPKKEAEFIALLETLEKLGNHEDLLVEGNAVLLAKRIEAIQRREAEKLAVEDIIKLKDEVKAFLTKNPFPDFAGIATMLMECADLVAETRKDPAFGESVRKEMTRFFLESATPEMREVGKFFEGAARRAIGKAIVLQGMTVDDKEFDWKAYRGKVVLIDFWASWCQPCIALYPELVKLYEKNKERGLEVVGVGVRDKTDNLLAFMKTNKTPWTVISDEATIAKKMPGLDEYYGLEGVPTLIVVDRAGAIAYVAVGEEVPPELIEKLLAEKVAGGMNNE
ncbi:MAG TPA: hypothetical protein DEB39_04620 [Planctomycetaceae bacterium]|nr:hypothetical protein [Planctomycetaceae bacterium]